MARAAILPAARIFSICSGDLVSVPENLAGAGFPTYSGATICLGTANLGETEPIVNKPF
jgi:hypothetical protein